MPGTVLNTRNATLENKKSIESPNTSMIIESCPREMRTEVDGLVKKATVVVNLVQSLLHKTFSLDFFVCILCSYYKSNTGF